MELKVTLDDFWLEEDEDISEALKDHLKNTIIAGVYSRARDKIEESIKNIVRQSIEKLVDVKLEQSVLELTTEGLKNQKLRAGYGKEVSLNEYIKLKVVDGFESNSDFPKVVRDIAKDHVKEIKEKYDLFYSIELLNKMKEAGLLNESMGKMLQEQNKTKDESQPTT